MQLEIEKLVYGGDGLARLPADEHGRGKTVFLPFVIPGEKVEGTIVETRGGFNRAKLDRVIAASPERVQPECPYFGHCGGCHYQHIDYAAQLRYKAEILRETLRRTAKLDLQQEITTHAAEPWAYRNRTRMHVRHEPEFALGYFRYGSHALLPVEQCPISSAADQSRHHCGMDARPPRQSDPRFSPRPAVLRQSRRQQASGRGLRSALASTPKAAPAASPQRFVASVSEARRRSSCSPRRR